MNRKTETIKRILDEEWYMFQRVKSLGGPAPCQSAPEAFRKIRGSIFETWSSEMLASYLEDLKRALNEGRNLLAEKYARMDSLIPPLSTNSLINKIVEIEHDGRRRPGKDIRLFIPVWAVEQGRQTMGLIFPFISEANWKHTVTRP